MNDEMNDGMNEETGEKVDQFDARLKDLFERVEAEIVEIAEDSEFGNLAFPMGMILHYGATRRWLQTMMDLLNTRGESEAEGADFIRSEVLKMDQEIRFERDEK